MKKQVAKTEKNISKTKQIQKPKPVFLALSEDLINHKIKFVIILSSIFIFSFLLYANTLSHNYALDDLICTTDNRLVQRGIDGIPDILTKSYFYGNTGRNDESYRPLSLVFMAVEKQFFGNNPKPNHFFNVLFYSISCVFLFLLLLKIFKKKSYIVPLLITLIFAAHPIHTEVVANIKSRDEILHFLFIILSLKLLFDYIDSKKIILILMAGFSYFLAIMSKENALTFVAIVPLMLYFFTDLKWKKIIILSLPYFLIAALSLTIRLSVLDTVTFAKPIDLFSNTLVAAQTIFEKYATNIVIQAKYILLLFFPHPLSWDYSYNEIPIVTFTNYKAILSTLVILGLSFFAFTGLKKRNPISFSIFYYFISISVVSNFVVMIATTMGERFLFTPSLAFCIATIFILIYLLKIDTSKPIKNSILFSIIGAILLLFSIKTIARNNDWKNDLTIYESGVKTSPNSSRTHLALGSTYRLMFQNETDGIKKQEYLNKAIYEYNRSIEILPDNPEVYFHLGYLYFSIGDKDKSLEIYKKALTYDPNHKNVLNYVGIIVTEKGDYNAGIEYFNRVISIDSKYVHAYNNLAFIYRKKQDWDNAIKNYKKIIEIDSREIKAYTDIGSIYILLEKYNEALPWYEKALKIDEFNKIANKDLGVLYRKIGNIQKAEFHEQRAK